MKLKNLILLLSPLIVFFCAFIGKSSVMSCLHIPGYGLIIVAVFLSITASGYSLTKESICSSIISGYKSKFSAEERFEAIKQLETLIVIAGFFFMTSGMILLFASLSDPKSMGPNMAFTLVSSALAVGFSKLILLPLRFRLAHNEGIKLSNLQGELLQSLILLGFPIANYMTIVLVMYSI